MIYVTYEISETNFSPLYQQHLLQQLPKFPQAPHEIFANGHDSSNGSGVGIETSVDFLVELSRLGQGNGILASPRGGWPQGRKNWSQRWRIFFGDFHFVVFLGLGFVLRRNKGSKKSKQTISLCFFCLVVVVVAKGVDFLGEDFIQNKCRLLWRSGLKCLDLWPTPLKSNMTLEMEHHHLLIGDTSSNPCFSIVMLVFGGCTLIFVLRTAVPVWQSSFPSWPPN